MTIKNYIEIEPVRSLAALQTLGAAAIVAVAYNQQWAGEAVAQIGFVWAGFTAFLGTFLVRNKVTPNQSVDQKVHDTIVELSEFNPPAPPQ